MAYVFTRYCNYRKTALIHAIPITNYSQMTPVEQQIANLRPSVKYGIAHNLHIYLLAFAALMLILSIVLWHVVPLLFATFFALVGFGSLETGPLLAAAIKAYDKATPTSGQVTVTITKDGDSDSYYAVVSEPNLPEWKYEFIPQGWRPVARTYPARIWCLKPGTPPNLAAVEDGILIPRFRPNHVTD